MNKRILVVGSINQDLVIQTLTIPKPGETIFGNHLNYFPGGKGANQAIAAKLLDSDVVFLGKVGDDLFGVSLKEYLLSHGIAQHIQTVSEPSGTAIIMLDQNGENSITVIAGANLTFKPSDFSILTLFKKGDVLLVQNEINIPFLYDLMRQAKNLGLKIIYNPAPAIPLTKDVCSLCDYIVVNEHELAVCFNLKNIDVHNNKLINSVLEDIADEFQLCIILTLGSNGCKAVYNKQIFDIPGFKVNVVDTTGAGDCFCGALAANISKNFTLKESLNFANKAASFSVTKLGASVSYPNLCDVIF